MEEIALLEELGTNAWPAERIHTIAGWRLRTTEGVTRRANSVWPNRAEGALSLAERIDAVEAFYEAQGLPACFHISPARHTSRAQDAAPTNATAGSRWLVRPPRKIAKSRPSRLANRNRAAPSLS